ncbi:MAG: biphenyl 2,3-dioxygenase [Gammaproteobacteria bacterium]|nr:biphenyl 2,3-dioxygenase [Gammaproteobacteria bacterium]
MNAVTSLDSRPDTVAAPIVPTKLAHFVIRAKHFKETVDWYRTVFHARTVFANEMIAFLSYDDEHHRMAFINTGHLPSPQGLQTGVDHIAFTYGSLADLLQNYARLKQLGITPFWCTNHGPTTSMYFRDPDGNGVEHQVDNFSTLQETSDFFYGPTFAANPIGVDYDPDVLLEKLRAGVPVAELLKQHAAPVPPEKQFNVSALFPPPN